MKGLPKKNALEWSVFAVSLLLTLGVIGYLVVEALAVDATPPAISVRVGESRRTAHGYAVRLELTNRGGETASGVNVVLTLRTSSGETESATAEVPFLPRGAARTASVLFRSDPMAGELVVASIAYEHP